jgi:hypothetical protein
MEEAQEGWGEALCYPSPATRCAEAGRSDNGEERRNSQKRGEWRRERNPDLQKRLGVSAWHCDKLVEIETRAWGPAGRGPGREVCDVV